jgi:hypothetical protein
VAVAVVVVVVVDEGDGDGGGDGEEGEWLSMLLRLPPMVPPLMPENDRGLVVSCGGANAMVQAQTPNTHTRSAGVPINTTNQPRTSANNNDASVLCCVCCVCCVLW